MVPHQYGIGVKMDIAIIIGLVVLAALIMELVDSSIGMMYGTILSPVLVMAGYEPKLVVPAILVSQAVGGICCTINHHRYENANFKWGTQDTKVMLSMVIPGVAMTLAGVWVALNLPQETVLLYIGILVILMGALCMVKVRKTFSWVGQGLLGLFGGFNKAFMGGGFGPVNTAGGVLNGLKSKVSIAATNYAEIGVCVAGFAIYMWLSGKVDWLLTGCLSVGAIVGGLTGPYVAARLDHEKMRIVVGIGSVISGIFILMKVYGYI